MWPASLFRVPQKPPPLPPLASSESGRGVHTVSPGPNTPYLAKSPTSRMPVLLVAIANILSEIQIVAYADVISKGT